MIENSIELKLDDLTIIESEEEEMAKVRNVPECRLKRWK
jgi:hypothetical protein